MQRLVLAVLVLLVLVGLVAVLVLGARAAWRTANGTADRGGNGSIYVRKLAFAALFILIVGVSVGVLGGL